MRTARAYKDYDWTGLLGPGFDSRKAWFERAKELIRVKLLDPFLADNGAVGALMAEFDRVLGRPRAPISRPYLHMSSQIILQRIPRGPPRGARPACVAMGQAQRAPRPRGRASLTRSLTLLGQPLSIAHNMDTPTLHTRHNMDTGHTTHTHTHTHYGNTRDAARTRASRATRCWLRRGWRRRARPIDHNDGMRFTR